MMRIGSALLVSALLAFGHKPLGIRIPQTADSSQITSSDITFVGYERLPSTGPDFSNAYGGFTAKDVGGTLHFYAYENWNGANHPPVTELIDTRSYNTTLGSAARATVSCRWGDIYDGKRATYFNAGHARAGRDRAIVGPSMLPGDLWWDAAQSLLFWTFYVSYNSGGANETDSWSLGATALPGSCGAGATGYGPWKIKATDGDGQVYWGWRSTSFIRNMPDGKLAMGGNARSITNRVAWGPELFGGLTIPTRSTPGGYEGATLETPDRYLTYYFPGNINNAGQARGNLRSFHWTPAQSKLTYVPEPFFAGGYTVIQTDPATGTLSYCSADQCSVDGGIWLKLPNGKQGVIFSGQMAVAPTANAGSCTANQHAGVWYRSAGQISIVVSKTARNFSTGETVTGGTSGAASRQTSWNGTTDRLGVVQGAPQQATDFQVGETLTGGTSKKTATVLEVHRHDNCYHNCACALCATGPSQTYGTPVFYVYDPDDLTAVKKWSATDYQTLPTEIVDIRTTYGIDIWAQGSPNANKVAMGYWDASRNYLFVMLKSAETVGVSKLPVLAVFHIADPAPASLGAFPLAVGSAVWMLGGLFRRRRWSSTPFAQHN